MKNPHALLGIPENASQEEIRRSYRKLVREHHPDLNPGDPGAEERFKELQQAYETLTNPENRRVFNRTPRPRAGQGGRVESSENLADLLERLGYRTARVNGRSSRIRHMKDEDVARILKLFGIHSSRLAKIKVSFGDFADSERYSTKEWNIRSKKPFFGDDFKKPPKPPKPPKW